MSDDLTLFQTDLFLPSYQPRDGAEWMIRISPLNLVRGYWSGTMLMANMAGLVRREADGRLATWMSMSPLEVESQELGCRAAVGDTVVMGLGMGWAVANTALRPDVTRVTVVERDPEVIGLIRDLEVFAQLPPEAAAKITVLQGDALAYVHDRPADTLLADIWLPLNGDDRVPQVQSMAAAARAKRVYFWGQEMVIARRARALGVDLDTDSVARIIDELRLPLIGPEWGDYPNMIRKASHWLREP